MSAQTPKKASIDDVARRAKVSITTVSRVINKVPTVNKEIATRVEEAIAFLKLKSFVVGQPLKDTLVTGKDLLPQMKQVFKTMAPFIDFLNRAIAE